MSRTHVGAELDLFATATRWKTYLRRQIGRYLGAEVLEVGAGFGGTTRRLCQGGRHLRWVCLEPDEVLAGRLAESIRAGVLPPCCEAHVSTLAAVPERPEFDAVVYVDVLEHIADDGAEMAAAVRRLRSGGHVVVLSPAHAWLFTPFDRAVGHHRRYTKATLAALTPPNVELVRLDYLDSVGLLASLGNRLLLRQAMPTRRQIATWDGLMVPLSRGVDPLLRYRLGKSVLGVWKRL
jgi:SAM-dependent methyltransferase